MQDFRNLKVRQKAHRLTLDVYKAKGCGRGSDADFARFLQNGMGSASELEYHLLLGLDLGYLEPTDHESLNAQAIEIKRMLATLIPKLRAKR